MNDRVLKTLEFDKMKDQLISFAGSSLGKEKASKLYPSSQLTEAVRWQEETDEARQVLRLKGQIPLGGIFDIRPHVKRSSIGGILTAFECLDVASTMRAGKVIKQFIADIEEEDLSLPILRDLTEQVVVLNELERNIKSCIDDHGHVMDGASEALRYIRTKIRSHENSVRDRLEQYTKSRSKMLSDAIVTIRNDRYVLPVKQEYRGSFGGIVHDQSSSGATLFVEPQSVVELNNKLQAAKVEEKQEMEKILQELSAHIANDQGFILQNVQVLQKIDFMAAKAKFSKEVDAAKPAMNDQGFIKMKQARHPLIDPDEVIPNDVEIGKDYTSIVITGPNTGGKTVTLKMIGLCTLMAQSGLQVPALDGCEMAVFDDVFADIGDEQSIEQSLSTFSSHMTNIVDILKGVHEKTLVLFDELGAGTDPQEGAGLAMAILDEVISRNARVIATTHYPELKAYGFNREGVMNASVEFDVKTLRPTYRLLLGVPGRSNAFEISRRLGLDENVINHAKSLTGQDSQSVENMIASLEEARKKADEDYEQAEAILNESYQLRKDLEEKWRQFEQRKDKLWEKAERKAEKEVTKARKEAEEIIEKLQNMKNNAEVKEHELIDAKKQLSEAYVHLTEEQKDQTIEQKDDTKELEPGDEVKVKSLNQQGSIVEKTGDKDYQVQLGMMKVKAKRDNLLFVKRPEPVKEEKPTTSVKGRSYHVKTELDLRGKRYEDALQELEKYVDNALLAGYPRVSIIHGKGTGALRKGVQKFAERHPSITSQRLGGMSEGGSGVTVLELG
ncbi:DNA mismatch repair protein MutS2 [Salinibacillus kushneri]|uniref:Endonuclease MutS2 n=1 Tax=Salinibacillus kushneri TaxID=237682 RepID=A0A1I0H2Z8_9BACI|nr:endonuclease MutS2 [Salinibacillus kushneri]SET78075.1 DNA mismatch repair protein MutS2 [Salinibacillus kushneri]